MRNVGRSRRASPNVASLRHTVLVIDPSTSLCLLLKAEIEASAGADVATCGSIAEAKLLLGQRTFTLAVSARNLPDGPDGSIVAILERHSVPMILLTATLDPDLRARHADAQLVDYFVKDNSRTAATVARAVSKFINNHAVNVLVVDDSSSSRSYLAEILQRQNYAVLQAKSAEDAISRMKRNAIDIVIIDYYMPGLDGYELTKLIREHHPSDELRVIGVSSSSDRMLASTFLKAGASDFLYRPFVVEELQCRLDNHVETLMQIRKYRRLSERDPLTGLFNRRAFFEKAEEIVHDLDSARRPTSIAVLDIDHFKRINDQHGHEVGDLVLQRVSQCLAKPAQSGKMLAARLGGEEFAILMGEETTASALAICEAIRLEIAALRVSLDDEEVAITVSMGLVSVDPREKLSAALRSADRLLYRAKSHGRNRTCVESETSASAA